MEYESILSFFLLMVMSLDDILLSVGLMQKKSSWKYYIAFVCLLLPSVLKMALPLNWFSHPLVALLAASLMLIHCILDILFEDGVSHFNVILFGVIFTLDAMVVAAVTGVKDMGTVSVLAFLSATIIVLAFRKKLRGKKMEMSFWCIALGIAASVFCEGVLRLNFPSWEPIVKTLVLGFLGWKYQPWFNAKHTQFRNWVLLHLKQLGAKSSAPEVVSLKRRR